MSKIRARFVPVLLASSLLATGCVSDAAGSGAASDAPDDSTADIDQAAPSSTIESAAEDVSPTTTMAESLAFGDDDAVTDPHQLWTDVHSVEVDWTVEFESDPTLEITGGYTAGQGLTARWSDEVEGDVLVMVRGDQVYRAYRVGNEVFFAAEDGEDASYFAVLLASVVEPLGTGILPPAASTYEVVDGVQATEPDVVYSLPSDQSRGTISIGDQVIDVVDRGANVTFQTPESELALSRDEVLQFDNPLLRNWYFDQAG